MSTEITGLTSLEQASLNSLYKNIAPLDKKIERIREREGEQIQKIIDKNKEKIAELEAAKEIFMPTILKLEEKKKLIPETMEEYVEESTTFVEEREVFCVEEEEVTEEVSEDLSDDEDSVPFFR